MKQINPWVKGVLDFGPLALFFAAYSRLGTADITLFGQAYPGLIVAALGFALLTVITTAILWGLTGRLSPAQIITLVVVLVMAAGSAWLKDDRFVKMKPTLIEGLFSAILWVGLVQGKSYLRIVLEEALAMQPEGWMILTRRYAIFFALLALANELIWRNFSTDIWVKFKVFGIIAAMVIFSIFQARLIERFGIAAADKPVEKPSQKP